MRGMACDPEERVDSAAMFLGFFRRYWMRSILFPLLLCLAGWGLYEYVIEFVSCFFPSLGFLLVLGLVDLHLVREAWIAYWSQHIQDR